MDLEFSPTDEAFRASIADWLRENLVGEFARARFRGYPGDEHAFLEERMRWERHLGEAGWIGLDWPRSAGGRDLPLSQQMIFHEEYARAGGPGRTGHIGEHLLAPTLIHYGSEEQRERFLPGILRGDEIWCQGYSEPSAGSDLANVQTRAELVGDEWVISGQKVWTSWAEWADWCFVLCRTDPDAPSHGALSYLLVPMRQDGIEVRPLQQITGTAEFGEVFFDGARTPRENLVGAAGEGWKVAMGTLGFERGASTLGQQLQFQNEFDRIVAIARENGAAEDPALRQRIADVHIRLRLMRLNSLRTLREFDGAQLPPEAMISKLFWATLHRAIGKLAMDVLGPEAEIAEGPPYELTPLQRLFLFTRSDTIYAGSNQIQRNIIGERALGLPREPRP
ncbi:MAG: acyl-CoA dehydrogenase family protein [Proteobacteria bacterium]|nr:acyl-CoA dehydrogenase family protein [Pseudomonadota bacterium]